MRWVRLGCERNGLLKVSAGSLTIALLLGSGGAGAEAATRFVSSLSDSGSGSLREAIADALPGDTIVLDADGVLSLTSGELAITNDLNISGPGADKLVISGNSSSRILEITSGSKVSVSGLTLTQGHAADGGWAWVWYPGGPYTPRPGDNGGAIYNAGFFTLTNCAILNSSAGAGGFLWYNYYASASYGAAGGSGGGIYNANTLVASGCVFGTNSAGPGSDGGFRNYGIALAPTPGADGGSGGALFNVGFAALTDCMFVANTAGEGGSGQQGSCPGAPCISNGGAGGSGGGIYNSGTLVLSRSLLLENSAAQNGSSGRSGGSGGGICNQGTATLGNCTLAYNSAGRGAGPIWGTGLGDPGGGGGAVYNSSNFSASGCAFYGNSAGHGGIGSIPFSTGGLRRGGDGGPGGGVANAGSASLTNCTLAFNASGDGGSGTVDYSVGGDGGHGGAIYQAPGATCLLIACTVSRNRAGQGGAGGAGPRFGPYNGTDGRGGGLFSADGRDGHPQSLSYLIDTITAGNFSSSGSDLYGLFVSMGHNLIGDSYGSTGFENSMRSDLVGLPSAPVDPLLGPLTDNGGPTPTMALHPASPAIDAGDDALLEEAYGVTTDERGFARKSGAHVDIGAFEFRPPGAQCSLVCSSNIQVCGDPGQCGAIVNFTEGNVLDCDGFLVTPIPASGSFFPVGTNTVLTMATYLVPGQITNTCSFEIIVHDCESPVIQSVIASPSSLWPPNHKMQPVSLRVSASDNCGPVHSRILSVSAGALSQGSGSDWKITGDLTVDLRAERPGGGQRVYTITVESADDSGNKSIATAHVSVAPEPHPNSSSSEAQNSKIR